MKNFSLGRFCDHFAKDGYPVSFRFVLGVVWLLGCPSELALCGQGGALNRTMTFHISTTSRIQTHPRALQLVITSLVFVFFGSRAWPHGRQDPPLYLVGSYFRRGVGRLFAACPSCLLLLSSALGCLVALAPWGRLAVLLS